MYNGTFVELSSSFKDRLLNVYQKQEWSAIWTALNKAAKNSANGAVDHTLPLPDKKQPQKDNSAQKREKKKYRTEFKLHNQLIYHVKLALRKRRLCIPRSMIKEMFKLVHDDAFHIGYHKAFKAIEESLYIRRLAHHLKQYIAFCLQCRISRTARHAPYGSMSPITSPSLPFHTICIDFIVAFLQSERFNSTFTVTDKFSKSKILILGQEDMTTKD